MKFLERVVQKIVNGGFQIHHRRRLGKLFLSHGKGIERFHVSLLPVFLEGII